MRSRLGQEERNNCLWFETPRRYGNTCLIVRGWRWPVFFHQMILFKRLLCVYILNVRELQTNIWCRPLMDAPVQKDGWSQELSKVVCTGGHNLSQRPRVTTACYTTWLELDWAASHDFFSSRWIPEEASEGRIRSLYYGCLFIGVEKYIYIIHIIGYHLLSSLVRGNAWKVVVVYLFFPGQNRAELSLQRSLQSNRQWQSYLQQLPVPSPVSLLCMYMAFLIFVLLILIFNVVQRNFNLPQIWTRCLSSVFYHTTSFFSQSPGFFIDFLLGKWASLFFPPLSLRVSVRVTRGPLPRRKLPLGDCVEDIVRHCLLMSCLQSYNQTRLNF